MILLHLLADGRILRLPPACFDMKAVLSCCTSVRYDGQAMSVWIVKRIASHGAEVA